jgi:hypothetical protein
MMNLALLPGLTLGVFASRKVLRSSFTIPSEMSLMFWSAFSALLKAWKAVSLMSLEKRDRSVAAACTSALSALISSASDASKSAYPRAFSNRM